MAEPGLPAASLGLVVAVALVETARLLAGGGEATGLAVLVDGVDDPVDAGIAADGLVLGVDEDDLEVLVGRVLVDPVRVQDAEVGAAAADTLLSGGLERALVLELVHTLVGGLACTRGKTNWSVLRCPRTVLPRAKCTTHAMYPSGGSYHRWHPWGPGACGHRGGRARGR